MKTLSFLRVEWQRLLRGRTTWLLMGLSALSTLGGYRFYQPATAMTKTSLYIGNPALCGALVGAILAALLTLFELDRVHKYRMSGIIDSIASPLKMNAGRLAAVLALSAAATGLAMAVNLPYVLIKTHVYFRPGDYIACYLILMLPGMWLGAIMAALFYQLVRRVDVSFVLLAAMLLLSHSPYVADLFLLRWANPLIPVLSDDFSNARILRMTLYSRGVWLLGLGAVWVVSLLCVGRYGQGIARSFALNTKGPALPVTAVACAAMCAFLFVGQPFIDHSPLEPVWADQEFNENVTIARAHGVLAMNTALGTLTGTMTYQGVVNKSQNPQRCLLEVNPGYTVKSVTLDGSPLPFHDLGNDEDNFKQITLELPGGGEGDLAVAYSGWPKEWAYCREYMWGEEISSDYIYLRGTDVTPMLNGFEDDGFHFICDVTLPAYMTPVASGKEPELLEVSRRNKTWRFRDDSGSQSLILYAADYAVERFNEAGMAIEFYYSRNHQAIMERLGAMDMIRNVLNYCAEHYGPLNFTKENPMKLVQESAYAMGGGAFRNFSVMGETTFSEETLDDITRGGSGAEVLAHEICHQWWGLTWMAWDEDEWSMEGLTCYTTYRLMKELYGEEYANANYIDVWQADYDAMKQSFYHRRPEYLDVLPEKFRYDIISSQWGVQHYSEMPLKLVKAAELLGGEDQLDAVLARLFQNTETENYPYLYYNDFLTAAGLTREELSLDNV